MALFMQCLYKKQNNMKYIYLLISLLSFNMFGQYNVEGQRRSTQPRKMFRVTEPTYNKYHYSNYGNRIEPITVVIGYDINGQYYLTKYRHIRHGLTIVKDYGRYSIVSQGKYDYLVDKQTNTITIIKDRMKNRKLF